MENSENLESPQEQWHNGHFDMCSSDFSRAHEPLGSAPSTARYAERSSSAVLQLRRLGCHRINGDFVGPTGM